MDTSFFGKDFKERTGCRDGKCCLYLKKGVTHYTCDDAALAYIDNNLHYAILGVFDGVSGESFGYIAAETALINIRNFVIRNFGKIKNENILELALMQANLYITRGATTASILLILPKGEFFYANVGDSHIYKISSIKAERITEDEKEAVGKEFDRYITTRNQLIQCLGVPIEKINSGKGKLVEGDLIFATSDGVCDNLFIELRNGIITDASGSKDIYNIIKNRKNAESAIKSLSDEIKKRMKLKARVKKGNSILVPKDDDISIVLLKY